VRESERERERGEREKERARERGSSSSEQRERERRPTADALSTEKRGIERKRTTTSPLCDRSLSSSSWPRAHAVNCFVGQILPSSFLSLLTTCLFLPAATLPTLPTLLRASAGFQFCWGTGTVYCVFDRLVHISAQQDTDISSTSHPSRKAPGMRSPISEIRRNETGGDDALHWGKERKQRCHLLCPHFRCLSLCPFLLLPLCACES
jgi:hypothetical protein